MKKLGKKLHKLEETIESYSCSCASCFCICMIDEGEDTDYKSTSITRGETANDYYS